MMSQPAITTTNRKKPLTPRPKARGPPARPRISTGQNPPSNYRFAPENQASLSLILLIDLGKQISSKVFGTQPRESVPIYSKPWFRTR